MNQRSNEARKLSPLAQYRVFVLPTQRDVEAFKDGRGPDNLLEREFATAEDCYEYKVGLSHSVGAATNGSGPGRSTAYLLGFTDGKDCDQSHLVVDAHCRHFDSLKQILLAGRKVRYVWVFVDLAGKRRGIAWGYDQRSAAANLFVSSVGKEFVERNGIPVDFLQEIPANDEQEVTVDGPEYRLTISLAPSANL